MQKKKLNKQQLKFCREWLKSHNAYDAAIKAGYSDSYARNATKFLLENIGIQEYIDKRTSKVEKQEDDEVDMVLTNIYRIATGKEISNHSKAVDNLKDKVIHDKTYISPADTKEQIAAAELWMKIKGQFKNDNAEIEKARVKKLNAEARIADAKADAIENTGQDTETLLTGYLKELRKGVNEDES
ncbi:prophage P1 protein 37, terminase small subunit TerS [Ligilactobacillus pabuli]|uniref:Prophage P1 protein 37, terminase small subunit TerS n=1 Tax=Ligilactobacillus pabuli TaxID=2886039 RepID=A0ABQ5JF90_9LACO|nr:terminase small subunit [Ligilactobacillus pabuli]GKS80721.1 prophage P1 protein 37, terminase small subunit TerS [Ligilactobacillus pabuli]